VLLFSVDNGSFYSVVVALPEVEFVAVVLLSVGKV
jgi:hypothetical protein